MRPQLLASTRMEASALWLPQLVAAKHTLKLVSPIDDNANYILPN